MERGLESGSIGQSASGRRRRDGSNGNVYGRASVEEVIAEAGDVAAEINVPECRAVAESISSGCFCSA